MLVLDVVLREKRIVLYFSELSEHGFTVPYLIKGQCCLYGLDHGFAQALDGGLHRIAELEGRADEGKQDGADHRVAHGFRYGVAVVHHIQVDGFLYNIYVA